MENTTLDVIEPIPQTEITKFSLEETTIFKWGQEYNSLIIDGHADKEGYGLVSGARKFIKSKRVETEKKIDELNRPLLDAVSANRSAGNILIGMLIPIEKGLKTKEEAYLTEVARVKEEKRQQELNTYRERVSFLTNNGCSFNGSNYQIGDVFIVEATLTALSDEEFNNKKQLVSLAYEIEQKAEQDRLEAIRLQKVKDAEEKETERLRVEAEKAEMQKQRDELAETARLQAAARKKLDDEIAELAETKRLAVIAEQEKERLAEIAKAEILEKERLAAIVPEVKIEPVVVIENPPLKTEVDVFMGKLANTVNPLAGDLEKMTDLKTTIELIELPKLESLQGKTAINAVRVMLGKLTKYIEDNSKGLE